MKFSNLNEKEYNNQLKYFNDYYGSEFRKNQGTEELLDQIQNLTGENTIFVAERHKIGSQEYNFINITDETDQYDDDEESYTTLIIIICVVVIFILALAAGLTFYFCRKSKKQRDTNTNISLIQRKEETVGETKEDE